MITGIFKANLSDSHEFIYSIFTWLGYMNSGCNPIIYAFSSRDFRRAFTKILCPARFLRKKTKLIGSSATLNKLTHSNHEIKQLQHSHTIKSIHNTQSQHQHHQHQQQQQQTSATVCATCRTYENLILARLNAKRSNPGSDRRHETATTTTTKPEVSENQQAENKIDTTVQPAIVVKAEDSVEKTVAPDAPRPLEYSLLKCKLNQLDQLDATRNDLEITPYVLILFYSILIFNLIFN